MWIDYGLRWKPEKYGGVKVVRIPHDAVWKPDILLYNKYILIFYILLLINNSILDAMLLLMQV